MIQPIQFPVQDSVILDGNNTIIKIQSDNSGVDYYFRAEIYIDDQLFDTQSWSRQDNFIAEKDLKYLYYSYFRTTFTNQFVNGLVAQNHLKKKVYIIIREISIETDQVVQTISLPSFYILYNYKPQQFDNTKPIQVLGLDTSYFRIPKDGTIVIPFYANTDNQDITVSTVTNTSVVLDTQILPAATNKQILLYTFNLVNISYSVLYVKTSIVIGTQKTEFIYKINRLPDYTPKKLVFKNNFGYFIPFYCFGKLEISNTYKSETYLTQQETESVFAIEQDINYKLNTNYLLDQEQPIVNQIALSLQSYFYLNNAYIPINTNTKNLKYFGDKEHIYNSSLSFTYKAGLPIDNTSFLPAPIISDLTVSGDENAVIQIYISSFEAIYTNDVLMTGFVFDQLPGQGVLKVVDTNNNTTVIQEGLFYNWTDVQYLTYQSEINESGSPYASAMFRLSNGYQFSNTANAVFNIIDQPDINFPPQISPQELLYFKLYRPQTGNGTFIINSNIYTDIEISVSDPENDNYTLLWSFPQNPVGLSISNDTSLNPTITANQDAVSGTPKQLKLTVTDSYNNVSEQIYFINVIDSLTVLTSDLVLEDGNSDTYDLLIDQGIPGESIDLEFDYDVYSQNSYVQVFSDNLSSERIVNLNNRKQTFNKTFNNNGQIAFQLIINKLGSTAEPLKITQKNPTGNSEVDRKTATITL